MAVPNRFGRRNAGNVRGNVGSGPRTGNPTLNAAMSRGRFLRTAGAAGLAGAAMMGSNVAYAAKPETSETYEMETAVSYMVDQNTPEDIQQFLYDLFRVTGISVVFQQGSTTYQGSNVFGRVSNGDLKFGEGLVTNSGIYAMNLYWSLPFGLEPQEFVSWLYAGGGLELQREIYASRGVVPVPFRINPAEGGGWFREQLTEGYLNGGGVKLRLYGIGGEIVKRVYPAVTIPPVMAGTAYAQFKSGYYTDVEFSFPSTDKYEFFDWPWQNNLDSIAQGYPRAAHYYISAWWQPLNYHEIWINKAFYDGLPEETKIKIDIVSRANMMRSLAESTEGQGSILKFFQDQGVTIHSAWPEDMLRKLKRAAFNVLNEKAAADPEFAMVLESMKQFAKKEQTRWSYAHLNREDRFAGMEGAGWPGWESIIE